MNGSLPSGLLVSALLKRVNDAGGMGMVRAKGDVHSGAILLILNDSVGPSRMLERALDPGGKPSLVAVGPAGPADSLSRDAYWRRRRERDPDLWVIELDIPSAERFAAETILGD
ncbi:DUF1491 family protein [Sphingomonas sp. PAMC 26605]|uniref:DUF1491 family protein n=1 Tax=Sphingomonas sp. PAMC 26605 TaxID=1112214 RepID=UPI00026CD047|nr:DUF1491 family protein [Sphingomonas sp. PAMC 26605]